MKRIAIIICLIIGVAACTKEDIKLTLAKQEENIEKYIQQRYSQNGIVRRNGSNRIIIDSAYVADSLVYGDSLHFYYAGYIFNTSPSGIFATNVEQLANSAGLVLTDQDFSVEKILFTEGCYIPGLVNGLYGVREGEHSLILFSAEHGFYNETVYNIPKLSALAYEVWIEKVIKNE
ncbi:MAG: hypothetical protein J6U71_01740 [Bacteroidales bacterium]|jgi:hypothetical protein|nr:hypothetical protein [Bacteroidales bacterium]MBQ5881535.1 hypothetical protein [Bacteroidales bacterium]MBR4974041.1 hypothetical protein [Bacteroidales bacterium]